MRSRKSELDYRSDVGEHVYELRGWYIRDGGLGFMHAVCSRSLQLHPIRHVVRYLSGVRGRKGELDYRKDVREHMYELRCWNILDRSRIKLCK